LKIELHIKVKYIKSFDQLFELHYTDTYGGGFHEFVDKYKKLIRAKKINHLHYFVQFTDHKDNNIDKSIYDTPDHSDPIGNYGYPIDYVLKHPSDIWYGKSAKYMRVLKRKTPDYLVLNDIKDENTCYYYARQLGIGSDAEIAEYIKLINKHYKDRITGSTKWAKIFIQLLQVDFTQTPEEKEAGYFSNARTVYPIRSGKEQTQMLVKAGIYCIEDRSTSNKLAIINTREPQQVIFLTPTSFNVEDVYKLHIDSRNADKVFTVNEPTEALTRKIVSKVMSIFDNDKIKDTLKIEYHSLKHYFSVGGRRVGISFVQHDDYYVGKQMGEKKHKEVKTHDLNMMNIDIDTEFGTIIYSSDVDEKVVDILDYITNRWNEMKSGDIIREYPMTSQKYEGDILAEREKEQQERYRKENEREMCYVPNFLETLKKYADRYSITYNVYDDVEENYKLYKFKEGVMNLIMFQSIHNVDDLQNYIDKYTGVRKTLTFGKSEEAYKCVTSILLAFCAEIFEKGTTDRPHFRFGNMDFEK
jgi:hypothetical protein